MNKTLGWKLALIVGTLLFFLFGIFGVPGNWSGQGLLAAMQQRIHLGLDLKGGTHLILQVQVNDAVNADAQQAMDRLKESLRGRNIYADITQPDPAKNPDHILIKGVTADHASDLRDIVSSQLPEYT